MTFLVISILFGVFVTAFISGVMSLGGGTILMGFFGWVLPVSTAMMLHGVTQIVSNGARGIIYWRHIYWPAIFNFLGGAAVCIALLSLLAYVPNKAALFFLLGLMPFGNYFLPKKHVLDITKRSHALICGFVNTACLLTAGVSGPILDTFYVRSPLTRYQVHATKGVTQALGHFAKIIYFAFILSLFDEAMATLPLWVFAAVIPLAYAGVYMAQFVLHAMSDAQFRKGTQFFNIILGSVLLLKAFELLLSGEY